MKKRFYQSIAFGLSTVLMLSSVIDVFAADEVSSKTEFAYLYIEDQCTAVSGSQNVLMQLKDEAELPISARMYYHREGDTKTETVDAETISGHAIVFCIPSGQDEGTFFLDKAEFTTENETYEIPFTKGKTSYQVSEKNETDDAVLYHADGQYITMSPIKIVGSRNAEESALLIQKAVKNMQNDSNDSIEEKTCETKDTETNKTTESPTIKGDAAHTGGELFWDVQKENWFYPAVSYVMNKGLMSGIANGNFGISESVNRAQLCTILYRMEGSPAVDIVSGYEDVPADAFYRKAVLWAAKEGLLFHQDTNSLRPLENITKEEVVFTLCQYAKMKGFYTQTDEMQEINFADADKITDFAKESVSWAASIGLIHGDQKKFLHPQEKTSRVVCASMITGFCDRYLPNAYPNISLCATADEISVSPCDKQTGNFTITVSGVKASTDVEKVDVAIWCDANGNDKHIYQAQKQNDQFVIHAELKNHKFHTGTYHIAAYAVLANGIRVNVGTETVFVEGNEAQLRIQKHINAVYAQTGKDLYACYQWVVKNIAYKKMPIPIQPPIGYTEEQWNAVLAFEQHKGNCFNFAAAFCELAKGLGYDARYVKGDIPLARGGRGPHGWVEITQNGAVYICDPDLQYEIKGRNFYMQPVGKTVIKYYR